MVNINKSITEDVYYYFSGKKDFQIWFVTMKSNKEFQNDIIEFYSKEDDFINFVQSFSYIRKTDSFSIEENEFFYLVNSKNISDYNFQFNLAIDEKEKKEKESDESSSSWKNFTIIGGCFAAILILGYTWLCADGKERIIYIYKR